MKTLSMVMEPEAQYNAESGNRTTPAPMERRLHQSWWEGSHPFQEQEPIALDTLWNDFHEGSGSVYPFSCLFQYQSSGPYGRWVRIVVPTNNLFDSVASPAEMLASIKSDLSLSMTEMAKILEVERPTLYSWLSEKTEPHPSNRERVSRLYMVAIEWRRHSSSELGEYRHRVFKSGKSLVELLKANQIPMDQVRQCLPELAKLVFEKKKERKLTGKELAKKYGIKSNAKNEEWDFISGKRIGME